MTKWLKNLWFKLTYDEIAMKYRRPLGKSLFIFVLMSGICSAQTSILTYDVNGVTKLHARLNRPATVIDPVPVYPPNPVYIGIPSPSFGIDETYRMYDDDVNQADGLIYYDSPAGGKYTHYVDNTAVGATDSGSNTGKLAKDGGVPRLTIPSNPPAGSIVEIHGGPYSHKAGSHLRLYGSGTEDYPIFFRGTGTEDLPRISVSTQSGFGANSTYIIIENLSMFSYSINPNTATTAKYIAVRNCEITGNELSGGTGVSSWITNNFIDNVVFYNNEIHDNGPWDTTEGDPDVHGIGIGAYVRYLWILDNTIYHCAGNGIQLTGAGPAGDNSLAHHVYMGGNTNNGLTNLQAFIGIKGSSDVIVSQNHVWNQGGYRTNFGMLYQYGPERVWFLFNTIHDISGGIGSGSNSVANPGQDTYIIGNLIYNIVQKEGASWNPLSAWSNAAIMLAGGVNRHIIGNTIYNATAGINAPSSGTYNIFNNIVSNISHPDGRHMFIESKLYTPDSLFNNNIFYQPSDDVVLKWGDVVGNVSGFEAGSGGSAVGNVEADPVFVNADANDFGLQETSPARTMSVSSQIQTISDTFYSLYGITNLAYYINQLYLQGVQNAPDSN